MHCIACKTECDAHDLLAEILVGDHTLDVGLLLVQLTPEVLEVRVAVHNGRVQHELRAPGPFQLQQLHFPLAVLDQHLGQFSGVQVLLDLVVVHPLGLAVPPVFFAVPDDDLVPVDVRGQLRRGFEPDEQQHERGERLQHAEEGRHPVVPLLEVVVGALAHLGLVAEVFEALAAVGAGCIGVNAAVGGLDRAAALPPDEDQNHQVLDPRDGEGHVCEHFDVEGGQEAH